jgi:hypothetical protein
LCIRTTAYQSGDFVENVRPMEPESIGLHRLLSRLGAGGMGTVYLAEDGARDRVPLFRAVAAARD